EINSLASLFARDLADPRANRYFCHSATADGRAIAGVLRACYRRAGHPVVQTREIDDLQGSRAVSPGPCTRGPVVVQSRVRKPFDTSSSTRVVTMKILVPAAVLLACGLAAPADAADWRALFNGKDLEGWEHVGPGRMVIEDGLLRTEGGMGLLWYTREKFGDCTLRVVYKTTSRASNSGVFVRVAETPQDEWYAVHHGYEVQICDGADEFHRTGAIYSMSKAATLASKVGQWNTMEITLKGPAIRVVVNGVTVQDFDPATASIPERTKPFEPERGPRPESGYIGLQNHDDYAQGTQVYFREVGVRPLD
ncbi:MAG TPA: family 16 glycoside hydrolase, partial [Isosphaeraceae bacterium]